jgi:hypothetical protein
MAWRLAFLLQGGKSAAITCRIDRCLGDRVYDGAAPEFHRFAILFRGGCRRR